LSRWWGFEGLAGFELGCAGGEGLFGAVELGFQY
jgi:hypothetical protein